MSKFVVYEVVYGGDVDGTGPERWHGTCVAVCDTMDEACDVVYSSNVECEIFEEDE
jgi:hypothetical protein